MTSVAANDHVGAKVGPAYSFLDTWVTRKPDDVAITFGAQNYTWRELRDRVHRNAAAQVSSGLQPGDRIAFLDKNSAACLETTLGAGLSGCANTVINFRLSPAEIAFIINDAQAKLLIVGAEFVGTIDKIRGDLPTVETVIVSGGEADQYEGWLSGAAAEVAPIDVDVDRCFLQLYTSGTTGHPKGAMLTHRGINAHNAAAVAGFGFEESTVNMVAMPLFHVGGTSWALAGMSVGARTIVIREVVPGDILDTIEAERVTHAFFVPAVYGFFLAQPDVADRDYSSLRCWGYGGSPMPLPTLKSCLETWPDVGFYQVYGMTEMSGVFSVLDAADHRDPDHPERLVSAGRPLPGVTVKVVGDDGEELPVGEIGEFWAHSQQHMAGYYNNPEATSGALVKYDWLRTGDAGSLDEAGYLYIQDRVKDMIISGGENVYPAEVERVLIEHDAVADVAVVGIPDEKWGEQVKGVVVLHSGATITPEDLIAYSREHLAGYKCPKSIDFVPVLPRNTTGKLLKRELREQYWGGRSLHD